MNDQEMARLLFEKEVRASIREVRNIFFQIIDALRIDDMDNADHLIALLKDEELAKKFSLFQENKTKAIRKSILDSTNSCERNLLEYVQNFDVHFREGIEMQGLFKGKG